MSNNSEQNRLKHFSKDLDYEYLLGLTFPKLSLKESKINGKGIYTEEKIPAGKIVCPLFGIPYNMLKAKIDYPKYSYQISDDVAIETSNEPGFFNHSCNPNVFINTDWMFEAMRDIEAEEEIVVDYATVDYFDYSFNCSCGSENCRKKFDGKFSANLDFQKRMSKYFSPYLKDRFYIIAPEVFRQRLLIELVSKIKIDESVVENFLNGIVKELNLKVSAPPITYKSGEGKLINEGIGGFVPLIDSGITINTWRQSGLVSIFLHTCKEFSEEKTINFVKKYFDPANIQYKRV